MPQLASSSPARGAETGQHATFDDELQQHAGASGAQCDAHGDFTLPRFGTRQQKIGDIGAGNQQHEGDGAEQDEQGLLNIAEELVVQRGHFDGATLVRLGIRRFETFGDAIEFGLRMGLRDSGFEAGEGSETAVAAFGEVLGGASHPERDPSFRLVRNSAEPGRHDANDGPGAAIELHGASDDGGVRTEASLPQAVAQDDDGVALRHFVLFRKEGPPKGGAHSKQVEVRLGDNLRPDALGFIDTGERHGAGIERGHGLEGAALGAPIEVIGKGGAAALDLGALHVAPEFHQSRRFGIGQRAENDGIDDAEDRRVGADPECQGERGDDSEAGTLAQRARGVAEILAQHLDPSNGPHLANGLLDHGGTSKPAARFQRLDSGAAGALGQVKLDLILQVAIQPAAQEQGPDAWEDHWYLKRSA